MQLLSQLRVRCACELPEGAARDVNCWGLGGGGLAGARGAGGVGGEAALGLTGVTYMHEGLLKNMDCSNHFTMKGAVYVLFMHLLPTIPGLNTLSPPELHIDKLTLWDPTVVVRQRTLPAMSDITASLSTGVIACLHGDRHNQAFA